MASLERFERIVRVAHEFSESTTPARDGGHPFDARNIHPDLPAEVRRLFDSGHFPQATFAAFVYVDEEMQRISGSSEYGSSMMLKVLGGTPPSRPAESRNDEVRDKRAGGVQVPVRGAMLGIRNPRGHKTGMVDDPDICLDHLSLASMLVRRLDEAGLR